VDFKRYLTKSYRPSFYDAKLAIQRWEPAGRPKTVQAVVTITNLSRRAFPVDGGHPIEVVAYLPQAEGPKRILSSEPLNRALGPGQSMEVPLTWAAGEVTADQIIEIDLLHREVSWFGEKGSQVLRVQSLAQTAGAAR
jgi:hypothetical protein